MPPQSKFYGGSCHHYPHGSYAYVLNSHIQANLYNYTLGQLLIQLVIILVRDPTGRGKDQTREVLSPTSYGRLDFTSLPSVSHSTPSLTIHVCEVIRNVWSSLRAFCMWRECYIGGYICGLAERMYPVYVYTRYMCPDLCIDSDRLPAPHAVELYVI